MQVELEETISEAEKSDRPLGEVLLERGLLAEAQLQKALQNTGGGKVTGSSTRL